MRTAIATLVVAFTAIAIFAPSSGIASTEVNVRIEGRTETLFEGPILTEGHDVRAAGDSKAPAAGRRCNGLNNNAHPTPGPTPTPTAAGVDAMAIAGEGFDGDWYAAPFEDYFITQWGPDRQSNAAAEYWGLVVNDVFTSVGGCQYQLVAGDEVLWVYDAFNNRPRLLLYPGDYSGGAVRLTAEAQLGVPFAVEVDAWTGVNEGAPSNPPPRSSEAFVGAEVAPVVESAKGFEEIDTGSAAAPTGADGRTSITFNTPGWHRIKATRIVAGKEAVIRSNRLDVCVVATLGEGCGPIPTDDLARLPPSEGPVGPEPEGPGPGGEVPLPGGEAPLGGEVPGGDKSSGGGGGTGAGPGVAAPAGTAAGGRRRQSSPCGEPAGSSSDSTSAVRLSSRGFDRDRLAAGLLGVSWSVRDPAVAVIGWRICSLTLDRAGGRYVSRASGRAQTGATLRLPKGAGYRLRLVVTDALGRTASLDLGKVRVPE